MTFWKFLVTFQTRWKSVLIRKRCWLVSKLSQLRANSPKHQASHMLMFTHCWIPKQKGNKSKRQLQVEQSHGNVHICNCVCLWVLHAYLPEKWRDYLSNNENYEFKNVQKGKWQDRISPFCPQSLWPNIIKQTCMYNLKGFKLYR